MSCDGADYAVVLTIIKEKFFYVSNQFFSVRGRQKSIALS